MLPTIDLLFFAFAIAGPVAMLWIVVMMLNKAAQLTEAITGQSDSALALAATLGNLNDSIDALSAGTTGRLEQACDRMEREAAASVAALDRNIRDIQKKLENTLLDSVVMLDQHVADRVARHEREWSRQQTLLDQRLNEDARQLAMAIATEMEAMKTVRERLTGRIEETQAELRAQLEQALTEISAAQRDGLDETNRQARAALSEVAVRMTEAQAAQTALVQNELGAPVREIKASIEGAQQVLAAHPPASAEAISDMLGETAQRLVREDRKALEASIARIAALETQARSMLAQIDRTARLNPLMDAPKTGPADALDQYEADRVIRAAELPFADLPRATVRGVLNWTAVIHVLDGTEPQSGTRHAAERAAIDPDVAALMKLGASVAAELAEDRIHAEDLKPEHAPVELWARFGKGERGAEIADLAGVSDDITEALVRARLRGSAEFHALALRFADAYARLIERAVAEIGADGRLIELAETKTGRMFMLLAGVLGAFRPMAGVREAD